MAYALSNTNSGFNLMATIERLAEARRTARAQRAAYRETYNALAKLSDRDLADIGVARSKIVAVAKERAATAK